MSKKTHEKELARARAKRDAERHAQQRTRRTIIAAVVAVVAVAGAITIGLLLQDDDAAPDPVASGAPTDPFATETPTDPGAVTPSEPAASEDPAAGGETENLGAGDPATGDGGPEPCENPGEGAPEPDTETQYDEAPPADDVADAYTVTMTTTCGDIVMELNGAQAPQTVASFVFLSNEGFYEGVPFHRVQDQFVIQGGDPTGTGSGGPGYQFEDELDLAQQVVDENDGEYPRGTLAMANSGPDTNGSQFFVVQADPGYPFPPDYAVFGEVVEGMDVVDRIAQGPVTGARQDEAVDPVRIISVEVEEGPAEE